MKLELTKFSKEAKKLYLKYKEEIDDIIIYGSALKGKKNPNDIDIIVLFREKVNKEAEYSFRNALKSVTENTSVNSITINELKSGNFSATEGLYLEGYSLIRGKLLSEEMNLLGTAIIIYNVSKIKGSDRIRFYYALNGRDDSKGFASSVGAKRLADNVLLCKYNKIEEIKPFFEQWKIPIEILPALIPKRLEVLMK
jgi:predicted nucleotidyltransferase